YSVVEVCGPALLAGLRIKRAETTVTCCANEYEASCRDYRTASSWRSNISFFFRQRFSDAERHAPGDIAGVAIDCNQTLPRWLEARQAADRTSSGVFDWSVETGCTDSHIRKLGGELRGCGVRVLLNPAGDRS